jgi:uncharacterized protein with PIN domain
LAEVVRFYLDEHVPHAVAKGLRLRGVDALTSREAGMLGAEDARQLAFAHQSGRVFITHDADFLRLDARGYVHAGIVFVPRRMSIGAVVAGLMLIHEMLAAQDMSGHVEYL